MTLYRKRPVVVEAHRWMRNDNDEPGALGNDHMAEWLGSSYFNIPDGNRLVFYAIDGRKLTAYLGELGRAPGDL